jgi:hypothetical protein
MDIQRCRIPNDFGHRTAVKKMGRWYCDKKDTVEDCRTVSIAFLRKNGYFCGWRYGTIIWTNWYGERTASIGVTVCTRDGENYARFQYTHTLRSTDEKTECDYKVRLVTTPCHLGGVRWWFLCPLSKNGVSCGRRVGTFYLPPGGKYYGCRHCYNLSYESRNERPQGRIAYMGHFLTLSTRLKKLLEQTNRWTYRGMPTRKAQRVYILKARLDAYGETHLPDLR